MKIPISLIFFGFHFQVMIGAKSDFPFQCDVPNEWMFESNDLTGRNFLHGQKWPGAIVKYELLNESLSQEDKQEVYKAMDDIEAKTCIRFEMRSPDEFSYVSIERDDSICGLANLCRIGGYQFARFGGECRDMNTMVHELTHGLCLGHEQQRKDRNNFLHFDGCSEYEIIPKIEFADLRDSIYDYLSQMHYRCGTCLGGWPTMEGVTKCGPQIQQGLSVLDADKLNDLYDCRGCHSHRWKSIQNLTDTDKESMVQFGEDEFENPYYLCRGLSKGEIATGKYSDQSKTCYVTVNGREHELRKNAEVFTAPHGRVDLETRESYKAINVSELADWKYQVAPIPTGRTAQGITQFATFAEISHDGKVEFSIGKTYSTDLTKAYFPGWGEEIELSQFWILVCGYRKQKH